MNLFVLFRFGSLSFIRDTVYFTHLILVSLFFPILLCPYQRTLSDFYLCTVVAEGKYVRVETSPPPELKEACVNDVFNSGPAYCLSCYSDDEN